MLSRFCCRPALGLALPFLGVALALAPGLQGPAVAQKGDVKRVSFKTFDDVELSGNYYPGTGGKRDAVVLLLHHFDHKKGGNQEKDGWGRLAAKLQKDGYSVLSFDFRGFGDSKTVGAGFWNYPHNNLVKKRGGTPGMPPTTIDQKDFSSGYYPHLVNDIAAARAYLDRRNDAAELNSSNIIVIGAGTGATLGSLWMAHESALRRDKNPPPEIGFPLKPALGDPEVKDVVCAIWLSISPTLPQTNGPGRDVGRQVGLWLRDANVRNKVPVAFVYGQKDAKGTSYSKYLLKELRKTKAGVKFTGEQAIEGSSLSGSALLDSELDTEKWVLNKYLDRGVMSERRAREAVKRSAEKHTYYYVLQGNKSLVAKPARQEVPQVNISLFLR